MKLESWDPDLQTLLTRIDNGDLDLQPDFQRGLVWNTSKQQRLIDTILRGWSVPPLHLLVLDDQKLAVLDGQQRLRAMHAFADGEFPIQAWEPNDPKIQALQGLRFDELPESDKRRFQNYRVSSFRLYDYSPDEPYELFFRLNLPTGLTQAEKRNALVGDSRQQIKELVQLAEECGWSANSIGFANTRMAYDDTLARCCAYLEQESLRAPLRVSELEALYRQKGGFSEKTLLVASQAIRLMQEGIYLKDSRTPLNKATLLTWLLAYARQVLDYRLQEVHLSRALPAIERGRAWMRRPSQNKYETIELPEDVFPYLMVYNDRASSRVTDVLSVLARDAAVWLTIAKVEGSDFGHNQIADLSRTLERSRHEAGDLEQDLLTAIERADSWGSLT